DSPDAPHCRIMYTLLAPDAVNLELRVSCTVNLATVAGREKIPGVNLDVGRPVLSRFEGHIESAVRADEWMALLLRSPNGSEYSLLLLLKVSPERASAHTSASGEAPRPMTAEEIAVAATFYYRDPRPDLIPRMIA